MSRLRHYLLLRRTKKMSKELINRERRLRYRAENVEEY